MDILRWLPMGRMPPLGCCLLILVMTCGGLLTTCKQVELHLDSIQDVWDGHRLLTHILCASDISLFLVSLFIILLLCWQLEEQLGTLCYLYVSCMCTLCCATLYLLMSWLLSLSPAPAFGYLGTQLALLMVQHPRLPCRFGRQMTFFLPCGILIVTHILSPQSPLLFHTGGVISGLISRSVLLSSVEWLEPWRRTLERSRLCGTLQSVALASFIPSGNRQTVPPGTDEREKVERLPFFSRDVSETVFHPDVPLVNVSIHAPLFAEHRDIPLSVLFEDPEQLENEMLKAGIQASLQDYEQQRMSEPTLHKSSVSTFRLQQLERMGFPTGPAVVALAATGKVDTAVSLLVEGRVGEDMKVTSERQGDSLKRETTALKPE
ncbi:rhomboid domain-containing protein 3 [Pelobates fuscus]|uniref:rhomboid domain-containing protein 3 n=1 Tax=Pelobates fuscus TaxID=191477 RepID=UPI002FE45613